MRFVDEGRRKSFAESSTRKVAAPELRADRLAAVSQASIRGGALVEIVRSAGPMCVGRYTARHRRPAVRTASDAGESRRGARAPRARFPHGGAIWADRGRDARRARLERCCLGGFRACHEARSATAHALRGGEGKTSTSRDFFLNARSGDYALLPRIPCS